MIKGEKMNFVPKEIAKSSIKQLLMNVKNVKEKKLKN